MGHASILAHPGPPGVARGRFLPFDATGLSAISSAETRAQMLNPGAQAPTSDASDRVEANWKAEMKDCSWPL